MIDKLQEYHQLRNQILDVFPEIIDLTNAAELHQKTELLKQWEKKTADNNFLVMVVGDFSRGKSTLINALLGQDLLPRRMTPCTGAITIVQHGDPPKALKTYWEDEAREPEEISFDRFVQEVTLSEPDPAIETETEKELKETDTLDTAVNQQLSSSPIRQLDLYYPAQLCSNGVQIADSPGLNEDLRQTEVTLDFLPRADAIVFVTATERVLANNEVKFIRDLLAMGFQHLFFVINFRDDFEEDEEDELHEMEEETREKLQSIIGEQPLRMAILSSKLALEGRIEGNPEKIKESHIEDLEGPLGHFLTNERGKVFLEGVIDLLRNSRSDIELSIKQRRSLREDTLEDLEQRKQSVEARMGELQERKQKIVETVEIHAGKARRRLLKDFRERMRRLSDEELPDKAGGWTCNQRVLITPGQYKKCMEYYVRQTDGFIQEEIADWANREVVPAIQQEVERLCDAIGDDARAVLKVLDEMRMEINAEPQLETLSGEKPVAVVERLMVAGIALVAGFPIVAMMGGLFGARQAAEQFAMQIGAGVLMGVLGVLNFPLFLAAGGMIAVINALRNAKSSKEAICDKVVKEVQMRIRKPTGEMEERLLDTIPKVFETFSKGISKGIDGHIEEIRNNIEVVINEKKQTEDQTRQQIETENQILERVEGLGKQIDQFVLKLEKFQGATD